MRTAAYWVEKLNLSPHPEGGHFREVYRSDESIREHALPDRYSESRPLSTSIYFLLSGSTFSAFHRLRSDEVWHFYDGAPVTIHSIDRYGNLEERTLGADVQANMSFQLIVRRETWFAAETKEPGYSLVGCTMAPGFSFNDFDLGKADELTKAYPQHKSLIERLTRV
ncbi:MAG: cupin domain-containing protein [Rhodothermales bacterium]|nr:cupin domain-containing protein [Rhodothermales bacterium]